MRKSQPDPRQSPLPPQYDVSTFRKRHKLTTKDAEALLEQAGDDPTVADSLARIHTTSKAKKASAKKAASARSAAS